MDARTSEGTVQICATGMPGWRREEPGWGQEGDGWRNLLAGSEIAVDEPEVE